MPHATYHCNPTDEIDEKDNENLSGRLLQISIKLRDEQKQATTSFYSRPQSLTRETKEKNWNQRINSEDYVRPLILPHRVCLDSATLCLKTHIFHFFFSQKSDCQ